MTAAKLVCKLSECGYRFTLVGDNIILKHTGRDDPKADEILPLVDELKQNKSAVMQYLKDEHFLNTFQGTVSEMAGKYKDRLFDYARSRNPENYKQFSQTENRINKYWDDGDYESFQKEMKDWKDIYFGLLKLFSGG